MTTRTAVLITWGALALALVSVVWGTIVNDTAWWVWAIWAALVAGTTTLHLLARRSGLM